MADIRRNKELLETIKSSRQSSTAPASDDDSTIKVTPRKEVKDGVIRPNSSTNKLKRPAPKLHKLGNWRDGSVVDEEKKSRLTATDSPLSGTTNSPGEGPVVNQLDDATREGLPTGRSLDDSPDMQTCKHCKKQFMKSAIKSHIDSCPAAKEKKKKMVKEKPKPADKDKEKATPKSKEKDKGKDKEKKVIVPDEDGEGEDDDDADAAEDEVSVKPATPLTNGIKTAKKSAGKRTDSIVDGDKKSKKRKADGEAEKAPKPKKKKEEPKPKVPKPKGNVLPKPKGPVDVEKQCGVITPNGAMCARSLTCKSHSMGAKRSVPGRSLPYDMLLAAYQKKNQAKQQKAAIDANAPLEDEEEANAGPVDSDDEKDAVMPAFQHFGTVPLVPQPILEPITKKYQRERLKYELDIATRGGTVNIFAVIPKNQPQLEVDVEMGGDGEDAPGEPDTYGIMGSRRSSVILPPQSAHRRASTISTR